MSIRKNFDQFKERYPKTVKYVKSHLRKKYRCRRCGNVVLRESRMYNYPFQCMCCNEDLYSFEVTKSKKSVKETELSELVYNSIRVLGLDA